MFRRKVVFVLGAGASKEFDLPLGAELKNIISKKLNISLGANGLSSGDTAIFQAIQHHIAQNHLPRSEIDSYLAAARQISNAMPQATSIDSYIETHEENEILKFCGKLSIVISILESEGASKLYVSDKNIYHTINFDGVKDTWITRFFQLAHESLTKENVRNIFDNVAFINFNYDRCVEHYLYHAVKNYYGISDNEAADIVCGLEIYHPYGVVGPLPFQDGRDGISFGPRVNFHQILNISNDIKTYSEQIEDDSSIRNIRSCLSSANIVVFLGFAFHNQNMELIKIKQAEHATGIFGTALGMSNSDMEVVRNELSKLFHQNVPDNRILLVKEKCITLFDEFWRTLRN